MNEGTGGLMSARGFCFENISTGQTSCQQTAFQRDAGSFYKKNIKPEKKPFSTFF